MVALTNVAIANIREIILLMLSVWTMIYKIRKNKK